MQVIIYRAKGGTKRKNFTEANIKGMNSFFLSLKSNSVLDISFLSAVFRRNQNGMVHDLTVVMLGRNGRDNLLIKRERSRIMIRC